MRGKAISTDQVASRAVICDVDGVISPVWPDVDTLPWRDVATAGNVFGPVLVSGRMGERLDVLHRLPDVSCWWLTSWTSEMRGSMVGFPGPEWPVVKEPDPNWIPKGRAWWKLAAVELWLDTHPEVRHVAWCDDDLRGGRPAAVRRRFASRGLEPPLLIAPATSVGLTPGDVERLEAWARAGDSKLDGPAATPTISRAAG